MSPRLLTSLSLTLLLASCATPSLGLTPPDLELRLQHRNGELLAATDAVPLLGETETPWSIVVQAFVLTPDALQLQDRSLLEKASLVLTPDSEQVLRGSPKVTPPIRFAFGTRALSLIAQTETAAKNPNKALLFAKEIGALADYSAIELHLTGAQHAAQSLTLARRGDHARLAIQNQGEDTQLLVIPSQLRPPLPCWLHQGLTEDQAIAWHIHIERGSVSDPAHVTAVARMQEQIEAQNQALALETSPWKPSDSDQSLRDLAWAELGNHATRRHALRALVSQTTSLTRDLSLTGSDNTLDAWVNGLSSEIPQTSEAAWLIERRAIQTLAERSAQHAASMSEKALLLRHFGESAHFATDLATAATGSETALEFSTWVRAENLRMLESSDPAARVRALDWLTLHKIAPAGYEPFASRDQRRAALRAAELSNQGGER